VPTKVVAVCSGKGGVGKTNVAVNMAIAAAQLGQAVLLFDADLGLANVDMLLGLRPARDISHVLRGECDLADIILPGPEGVLIVPASSGVARMANLSAAEQAGIVGLFGGLDMPVDLLLVDTGAGIDTTVINFVSACQFAVVVIQDEPTSLADAYALIKVLHRDRGIHRFQVVVNMADNDLQGRAVFHRLEQVCARFLPVHLDILAVIPADPCVVTAVREQRAVVVAFPRSPAALALRRAAQQLTAIPQDRDSGGGAGGLGFFVERLLRRSIA
jgi:flagellar biosynthesis protein FlhG